MCAAFGVFGSLIFGLFASGELEEWSKDPQKEICISVVDKDVSMPKTESLYVYENDIQHTDDSTYENNNTNSTVTHL